MTTSFLFRLKEVSIASFLQCIKVLKLSFIVGSNSTFFSAAECFSPLVGLCGSTTSNIIIVWAIRTFISFILNPSNAYSCIVYHVPTFFGALYTSTTSKFIRLGIPVLCILIFLTHYIGSYTSIYTLYWLIPIVIGCLNTKSIFLQALGSTLTSHAVGSIVWLYTHSITPTEWNMLINIVWAERLIMGLIITCAYYSICALAQFLIINKTRTKLQQTNYAHN